MLARADPADRARQQEGASRRPTSPTRAAARQFAADRADDRAARGQHRQGRLQGRRHVLHVLPGRVVRRQDRDRARGKWRTSVPQEIYKIPASSSGESRDLRDDRGDNDDEWVTFAAAAGYTGMMVAWGCTVWGSGWYYPPYYGFYGGYPVLLRRTSPPTATPPGTTRGPAPTDAARASTVRTAAPASARATTRAPAPMRAARRPTVRTARAAWRRPTTRAPAPTRRRARARTSTAAGDRPRCSAATTGPRPIATPTTAPATRRARFRPTRATPSSRKGDNGGRVAAGSGGNVYAGKDGNVYRKDSGGTWQKYDNGGWKNTPNQPRGERPTPNDANRTGDRRRHHQPDAAVGRHDVDRSQHHRSAESRLERPQRRHDSARTTTATTAAAAAPHGTGSYRVAAALAQRRRRLTRRRRRATAVAGRMLSVECRTAQDAPAARSGSGMPERIGQRRSQLHGNSCAAMARARADSAVA